MHSSDRQDKERETVVSMDGSRIAAPEADGIHVSMRQTKIQWYVASCYLQIAVTIREHPGGP